MAPNTAMSLPPAPLAGKARNARRTAYQVSVLGRGDERRASLEAFIARTFLTSYGAHLRHYCDTLLGCSDERGEWIAALGYTLAAEGEIFLEQYLDSPLESEIAARTSRPVARGEIVEVGNLAAAHAGAARALIVHATCLLHQLGLRWVAFTATPSLLNSFNRLRLQPRLLAQADPSCLPDAGRHWGSYYHSQPQVMFGDIHDGYAQLA